MLNVILIGISTLFFGPFLFWQLNQYQRHKTKNWPVGIIDSFGDLICLPWFNMLIIYVGLSFNFTFLLTSLLTGLILTTIFVIWRKDVATHNDWTRPRKGSFNFSGWYYTLFHLIQSTFIVYGLLQHGTIFVIWLPLILFLLVVSSRLICLGHFTEK